MEKGTTNRTLANELYNHAMTTSSDVPPLPHLTGPVPVPPNVKRGRVAFWLSAGSCALFVTGFGVFIYGAVSESKNAVWATPAETAGVLLFFVSPVLSLVGTILGITTRKQRAGKAAIIAGAANVVTWVALIVLAVWSNRAKH